MSDSRREVTDGARTREGKLVRYQDSERSRYEYLRELPAILLGLRHHPDQDRSRYDVPLERLKPLADLKWRLVAHQTAGHACHQHYFAALLLEPKSVQVLRGMEEVARRYYDSQLGWFDSPSLDDANEYRGLVQDLFGLDCNSSYHRLEEAIYPLDLDPYAAHAALAALVDVDALGLPDDLSELIVEGEDTLLKPRPGFELYVLGENSD